MHGTELDTTGFMRRAIAELNRWSILPEGGGPQRQQDRTDERHAVPLAERAIARTMGAVLPRDVEVVLA